MRKTAVAIKKMKNNRGKDRISENYFNIHNIQSSKWLHFSTNGGSPLGILDVKDITLRFGGVVALNAVTYEVKEGEIFSLIGPNRAGKTSMLNCISGLYRPTEVSISFKGNNITPVKPHNRASLGIARAFQNIELFPQLSVLDNLMLGRHVRMKTGLLSGGLYWGKAQKEEIQHREKVENVIDFLEIEHIRNTPVGRLAYVLQKRVEGLCAYA